MDFSNQYALVTGASRGIGYALAKALGMRGAHVIATARTQGGLEQLDDEVQASKCGGKITLAAFDLCDLAALDNFIASSRERLGRLDILVGNAAELGELTPVAQLSATDLQHIFTLNFFVNQQLIKGFEQLLQKSPHGRALFLTSGAVPRPRAFWGGYSASKAALANLVLCWADEVKTSNLRVNLLNPGPVATRMWRQAYPGGQDAADPEIIATAILPYLTAQNTQNAQILNLQTK